MDMDYKKVYEEWLTNPFFDEATRQELAAIKDDEREIKERFYMDLEFGTAGLRGIIGAGTNRMNNYIVRKGNTGTCKLYQHSVREQAKGVAIAYDSRHCVTRVCRCSSTCVWQQTASRHMCLSLFVQHQSFLLQSVTLVVWQVLT